MWSVHDSMQIKILQQQEIFEVWSMQNMVTSTNKWELKGVQSEIPHLLSFTVKPECGYWKYLEVTLLSLPELWNKKPEHLSKRKENKFG